MEYLKLGHAIRKGEYPLPLFQFVRSGFATGGNMELTQDRVRELFSYRDDGALIWKVSTANIVKVGDVAGHSDCTKGYMLVGIDNSVYKLHKVVYLYHYGVMPEMVDHINRVRDDNRIENLRPITNSKNRFNANLSSNNKTGKTGVERSPNGKFRAGIRHNKKYNHLGTFTSFDTAVKARKEAELKYFGEYSPA